MGFAEASAYLDELGVDVMKSMRPDTSRIEAICEALVHPERAVPAIHITGTNGKTSTARIASSLLAAAGLNVATYTSPHLQTVRERLSLNGEPVSEAEFGAAFDHLKPYLEVVEAALGERLTYFEVLTAMFYLWAAETASAMVVEVGLGGRYDATNVVPSQVAVVTNIGLDHTQQLSNDRATIAREKSGIAKPDGILVTGERDPQILTVISEEASAAGSGTSILEKDFSVLDNKLALGGRFLSVRTSARDHLGHFLPLHGAHQGVNAAVALEAITRFIPARELDDQLVAEGFGELVCPGRLETVPMGEGSPRVLLDVAHNPDGMSALISSLIEEFAFEMVTFVIGILADKDYTGMLLEIARVPARVLFTMAESVRSVDLADLKVAASEVGLEHDAVANVADAVDAALEASAPEELVCITGSHYVVGEARSHLIRE